MNRHDQTQFYFSFLTILAQRRKDYNQIGSFIGIQKTCKVQEGMHNQNHKMTTNCNLSKSGFLTIKNFHVTTKKAS